MEPKKGEEMSGRQAVSGRQADRNILTLMMKEETSKRSVVSIVGMAGLGKTTLAKKVYNERDVQGRFDFKP